MRRAGKELNGINESQARHKDMQLIRHATDRSNDAGVFAKLVYLALQAIPPGITKTMGRAKL